MTHELEVSAVVTRDVLDAVGELLPFGEQLLELLSSRPSARALHR